MICSTNSFLQYLNLAYTARSSNVLAERIPVLIKLSIIAFAVTASPWWRLGALPAAPSTMPASLQCWAFCLPILLCRLLSQGRYRALSHFL